MKFTLSNQELVRKEESFDLSKGDLILVETIRKYSLVGIVSSLKEDENNSELYFEVAYKLENINLFEEVDYPVFTPYNSSKTEDGKFRRKNSNYGIANREIKNIVVGKKNIISYLKNNEDYKNHAKVIKNIPFSPKENLEDRI